MLIKGEVMRKNAFSLISLSIIMLTFFAACPVALAAFDEGTKEGLKASLYDIGRKESVLAATGDVNTRLLVEEAWRKRINEILIQLEKKGVNINTDVLEAVVAALGIDSRGPLTNDTWTTIIVNGRIPPMDQKTIEEYLDPSQYISDVQNDTVPNNDKKTSSPSS